jgi:hypothetical protein
MARDQLRDQHSLDLVARLYSQQWRLASPLSDAPTYRNRRAHAPEQKRPDQ